MDAWDILAIVLCIGVIALVGFMIPILIQIKDLLKMAENTVTRIEKDVEPVLHNFEGITQNFQGITEAANNFVNRPPSTEPGMIENIKDSVTDSVEVVKNHYVPMVSRETNRYLKAFKIGLRAGINKFQSSRSKDIMRVISPANSIASTKPTSAIAEDIIIVDHQIIKR